MKNKEKQILNFLKKNGRSSTTKLAFAANSNPWMILKYLEKLEQEGKIVREKETRATYWRLKNKNGT